MHSQTNSSNRQVVLKSRPTDIPQAEHFEIVEAPIPAISDGEVLIRNIYLSVEPAMRGWVSAVANYSEPVPLGGVMRSLTVGEVVQSLHPDFRVGDFVTGMFGWQDYAAVNGSSVQRKLESDGLPISTALGILGINGVTAYFGLGDVGQPKSGDTVVVSTAAGAVGSCVGQLAKIQGCRTVGITGGPDKVKLCREVFQYDEAIDYRSEDVDTALAKACPNGVDVYFDNTCGPISDAAMKHINVGARIVLCGTAAITNWDPIPLGPRVQRQLLVKRARMQGFLVFDYANRYGEAISALTPWIRDGKLRYREDILEGIDKAPDAIASLYRGDNLGKRLIRIAPDPGAR
ncbi:MAG: NADP-dependent oxidoreductase [Porticoccaceae bacterium]